MGSRTRERPPTRWIYTDDVENDLKTLNIKNWQRVAAYRWNWRKRAVEAAKTCNRECEDDEEMIPPAHGVSQYLEKSSGNGQGPAKAVEPLKKKKI
ncbi:hypothetical protein TNCV_1800221 [Trichonephila clavipes]|nr:hypothetical protein TNCV_1800221 [Trichonephila clavipes]